MNKDATSSSTSPNQDQISLETINAVFIAWNITDDKIKYEAHGSKDMLCSNKCKASTCFMSECYSSYGE